MAKQKKKIKLKKGFQLGCIVILVLLSYMYFTKQEDGIDLPLFHENEKKEQKEKEERERIEKENAYNACINKPFSEEELTEELASKKQVINSTINNNHYKVSVYYEDIKTGFTYTYKPETVYYGASLIKLVDALYLINQAMDGNIDLEKETIVYKEEYKKAYSSGMKMHQFGEAVSLKNLILYAISVSDNSAHMMLYDYIGREKLRAFGQSLGAKNILTAGTDKFGNQSAKDTNLYLKEAYRIITENEEYGPFLKEIMDNNVRNSFNTQGIKIYHKYGACDPYYYHDIGLNLEEHPYAISILTLHENSNYQEVVQNIHQQIIELQNLFYQTRENNCHVEIYGN